MASPQRIINNINISLYKQSLKFARKSVSSSSLPLDNMIGCWLFDDGDYTGAPNEVIDSSGNGYHGRTFGVTYIVNRNSINRCIKFQKNSINLGNPLNAFDFSDSDDWSIGCWFKTKSNDRMEILQKGNTAIPVYHLYIHRGILIYEAGITKLAVNSIKCNDDNWHLVVVTIDRTADIVRLYYDGIEEKTLNIVPNASYDGIGNLMIGTLFNGTNQFIGEIDDVFIRGKVTTLFETLSMYNRRIGRKIVST